ncbi:MAG: hypothetical protein IJP48_06075 [Synergistaceae bacterium]|nr:hypothetical protein [Synergistaceae bacterium]
MTQKIRHSGIYERLVSSDHDFLGQVAYSIYKQRKREFIMRKQAELGTDRIPDEVIDEFIRDQTNYTLELYMAQADSLSREFLNASYKEEIDKEKQRLNQEYIETYKELAKSVNPSWWYGVSQSLAASFLFVFIGYLILKFNGVWDILLQNLFK